MQAKGYCQEEMIEPVKRYVPRAEARSLLDELKPVEEKQEPGNEKGTDEETKTCSQLSNC